MKFAIPEISWHNRDPVLSVDFQPKTDENGPLRLATGGTDSHVLIWYVSTTETGSVNLEVAADLARHQKAVNVVRWAPNGVLLASGDDESIIFVWKQKSEKESVPVQNLEGEEVYKETWVIHKTLRGHMEDVLDLSWSPDSLQLSSGSVDNKLLLWDVAKGKYSAILSDHKGFVQGVAWDPRGQYIATASSDRTFRVFEVSSKKVVSRSSKAVLPFPPGHALHGARLRLFHDDTLQTFYRRLQWSPDGALLAVPAGRAEPDGKGEGRPVNALYVYTRYSLKTPACILPTGEPALVSRWCPIQYKPRPGKGAFPLPSRMLLAVGTRRALMLYDTHQKTPVLLISNIHYTRLTDLTWSADGRTLVASSTDGFCSVISFAEGELGEPLPPQVSTEPMEVQSEIPPVITPKETEVKEKPEPKSTTPKIDSFIKFKAPTKSPKKAEPKTPVKLDIDEVAMPSWSDNSNNDIIRPKEMEVDPEIMVIEDSEDFKLVYEESQSSKFETPAKTAQPSPETAEPSPSDKPSPKSAKLSPKSTKLSPKSAKLSPKSAKLSPKSAKLSPKSTKLSLKSTKLSPKSATQSPAKPASLEKGIESTFFKQAKVTDAKTIPLQVPSPKAPRRVNFVTLSSPKNKKKL